GLEAENPVELRDAVAAAEEVRRAVQPDCGGIVERLGQPPARSIATAANDPNLVGGRVAGGQAAEQDRAAGRSCRRRVLDRHGEVTNRFWSRLYEEFPEFQFVLYDHDSDRALAEGHTIPCRWDGTAAGLPRGIDGLLEDAFALREAGVEPNTLSALAIEIAP